MAGGEFGDEFRKAHPVPLAEEALSAGIAQVGDTPFGTLGVAICFDAVFGSHLRALTSRGAQAVLATSDDSSFIGGCSRQIRCEAEHVSTSRVNPEEPTVPRRPAHGASNGSWGLEPFDLDRATCPRDDRRQR